MARVQHELQYSCTNDYSAKFVCALAFTRPGTATEIFDGEVCGTLAFPPRGTKGFGYDPIFIADGMAQSFGEIDPARKHAISHRVRAFTRFVSFLRLDEKPA
jgi:XTP/dITP diphosphohydrolase